MFILLILLSATLTAMVSFGNKKFQVIMPKGQVSYAFYAIISGVVSLINFSFISGFSLEFKTNVALCAFIYALICHFNYIITFNSLQHNGVLLSAIFSRAGSLIMPMVIYALFFGEKQPVSTVVGALCMMVAIVIPMLGHKTGKGISMTGILYALAMMLVSAFSVLSSKILVDLYGSEVMIPYVFITNIFMTVIAIFHLLFACKQEGVNAIVQFTWKHYLLVVIISFACNYGSVVSRWIYEYIDVITCTVVLSGINMLVTVDISLYFKEILTKRYIVCVLLAIISAVLPVII